MFPNKINDKKGFTLIELLMAVMILLPLFTIVMQSFVQCMQLNDMARNSSAAVLSIKSRMATIENTNYNQIFNTYNNTTFTINGMTGMGKTYIDNSSAGHLVVKISFSWKERDSRIIGEDTNLNGVLNAGEDKDGNGQLDSLVGMTTQIYDMT